MFWIGFLFGKGRTSRPPKRDIKSDARVEELALAYAESYLGRKELERLLVNAKAYRAQDPLRLPRWTARPRRRIQRRRQGHVQ